MKRCIKINQKKLFICYALIISITLLFLSVYRAINSGIIYDEALTYFLFIKDNFISTVSGFGKTLIPNNHLLNTILISLLNDITGQKYNDFLIRLPNLICYLLYFLFAYKFSKNKENKFLLFALLSFNYGLNEYSSVARGYCMATSFVMLSVLFFDDYLKTNKDKYINYFCYASLLACYSNTVSLIIYGALLILILTKLSIEKKLYTFIKENTLQIIVIAILTCFIIAFHLLNTINSEWYIYGNESDFFGSVICSLFNMYGIFVKQWFFRGHIMYTSITVLVKLFFLIIVILILKNLKKLRKNYYFYLFPLCLLILVVLTLLTHSKWLVGRCIIPFIPIFSIWIMEIIKEVKIPKVIKNCEILLILFLIISFISNLSLDYIRDYNWEAIIKKLAFEAYETKNNQKVKKYKYDFKYDYLDYSMSFDYYQKKFLLDYNYDISK